MTPEQIDWANLPENLNPTDTGAHIALVKVTDPYTRLRPMATGVVTDVDDAGTVHVQWDDGSTLGLIPGVDQWRRVHPRWEATPLVEVKTCRRCGRLLPLDSFGLVRTDRPWRRSKCKDCEAERQRDRRKEAGRG